MTEEEREAIAQITIDKTVNLSLAARADRAAQAWRKHPGTPPDIGELLATFASWEISSFHREAVALFQDQLHHIAADAEMSPYEFARQIARFDNNLRKLTSAEFPTCQTCDGAGWQKGVSNLGSAGECHACNGTGRVKK